MRQAPKKYADAPRGAAHPTECAYDGRVKASRGRANLRAELSPIGRALRLDHPISNAVKARREPSPTRALESLVLPVKCAREQSVEITRDMSAGVREAVTHGLCGDEKEMIHVVQT